MDMKFWILVQVKNGTAYRTLDIPQTRVGEVGANSVFSPTGLSFSANFKK